MARRSFLRPEDRQLFLLAQHHALTVMEQAGVDDVIIAAEDLVQATRKLLALDQGLGLAQVSRPRCGRTTGGVGERERENG